MFATHRQRRDRARRLRVAALLGLGLLLFLPEDLSWLNQAFSYLGPVTAVEAGEPAQ